MLKKPSDFMVPASVLCSSTMITMVEKMTNAEMIRNRMINAMDAMDMVLIFVRRVI